MEKMNALKRNGTWDIVDFPNDKGTRGCKWVFTIKHKADLSIDTLKI